MVVIIVVIFDGVVVVIDNAVVVLAPMVITAAADISVGDIDLNTVTTI